MTQKVKGAIRGTTVACLKHMTAEIGTHEANRRYRIWDPKTNRITIRHWFMRHIVPTGDRCFALQTFLELAGYTLIELEKLLPEVRALRAAVVEEKITVNEIKERIGYTGHSTTYQMLHGNSQPSGIHLERVRKIAAQLGAPKTARESESAAHAETAHKPLAHTPKAMVIDTIVPMIQSLWPLAELVVSDKFTPREREEIRKRVGEGGVFHLKNTLAKLCSERARDSL